MKSLPIDKTRIYVTGHSMGGFGTCHLLAAEPRLFAAGIADRVFNDDDVHEWLFAQGGK